MKTFHSLIPAAALLLAVLSPAAAQAPHKEKEVTKAIAVLQPTKGSNVKGTVTFTKSGEGIRVEASVTGLTPGKHGFHVHQFGDLSSPDGKAAGDHFNPTGDPHGGPDAENRHAGDLGNLEADESGAAKYSYTDKHLSFEGSGSILGRGVVVHAKADDLKSQPSGDAGARLAVGVIGVTKGE
jgi:Cu-Zn family superoxide dismutase